MVQHYLEKAEYYLEKVRRCAARAFKAYCKNAYGRCMSECAEGERYVDKVLYYQRKKRR